MLRKCSSVVKAKHNMHDIAEDFVKNCDGFYKANPKFSRNLFWFVYFVSEMTKSYWVKKLRENLLSIERIESRFLLSLGLRNTRHLCVAVYLQTLVL